MPTKYFVITLVIIGVIVIGFTINRYSINQRKAKSNEVSGNTTTRIAIGNKEYEINKSKESQKNKNNEREKPQAFGYKCSWLAIKSTDNQKIIKSLALSNVQEANWTLGLSNADKMKGQVFVSPPLGDWTLVIGLSLPYSGDSEHKDDLTPVLLQLSKEFGEVQYFGTYRVVDYNAWAKVVHGKIVRAYGFIGERNETIWNIGEKTKEEVKLGFNFFNEKSKDAENKNYWERTDLRYPDEEDVLNLSKEWSVDTSFENNSYPAANGVIGNIKIQK